LKVYAAKAHQAKGATINTQTTLSAASHSNNAGQKLLAGLTEVPVSHNPNKCTSISANQITIPAILLYSSFDVTQRIVYTNTKVRIISASNPNRIFQSTLSNPFAPRTEKSHHKRIHSMKAQIIPQIN
jgi:hypothetical protein